MLCGKVDVGAAWVELKMLVGGLQREEVTEAGRNK